MEKIFLDKKNSNIIKKYIKKEKASLYGYEEDIEIFTKVNQLTEELARKIFTMIMDEANRIRNILTKKEEDEFAEEIDDIFSKFDKIPKPELIEEYGFYDNAYIDMELDEVYEHMQTAFEVKELDQKYYYYRDLRNIAHTAINSINGLDKYNIKIQPEVKNKMITLQKELQDLLQHKKTDIQAIRNRIDVYNKYAIEIWNEYLTSIGNEDNGEFRWVVHNLTKGELQGEFKNKYMSTSLITNNIMGLYGNSNYGLIIKPKHIISAQYKDSYTLNSRDDEEDIFNIKPPIMLPQEIEEICINQTIEENGEPLNYEKTAIYPELVIDEYEIEGMYYISNGEHELARNYERAKKMAEERGMSLVERDISKYREEHGLQPMTETTKIDFCRNILQKCCDEDKILKKLEAMEPGTLFTNQHAQEFYEKYMLLRRTGDVSTETILKAFADVARDDVYFSKIAEIVDKKYPSDNKIQENNEQEEQKGQIEYLKARKIKTEPKTTQDLAIDNNLTAKINECGEILRPGKETIEMKVPINTQGNINKVNTISSKDAKIRPKEESIRDEVGDEQKENNEIEEKDKSISIDLWMNRFSGWYGTLDRVNQSVKAKFVKMKSDITRVIREKIIARSNKKDINKIQNPDGR